MQKTTLYLPRALKRQLERLAASRGCSEAELIREALEQAATAGSPRPRLPLFRSRQPRLAERVEQELKGFGEK